MPALKFLRRNLFACLQEVTSSFRLFSVDKSGRQIIKYFSHRHKLHRLEAGLYGVACFNIFHDILKSVLVSFNCQMLPLVGAFLLHKIKEKHGNNFGLYRDDGLGVTTAPPRQVELIKKDLCAIFSKHGLRITIEANKKIVNFLDVTLNLTSGKYMPYTKPDNIPLYVNKKSNHPPQIIKNIPKSINNRLSEISFDEESFNKAAPLY